MVRKRRKKQRDSWVWGQGCPDLRVVHSEVQELPGLYIQSWGPGALQERLQKDNFSQNTLRASSN